MQRAGGAPLDDGGQDLGVGSIRLNPGSPGGVEDHRQAAYALGGVQAAHGVVGDLDLSAGLSLQSSNASLWLCGTRVRVVAVSLDERLHKRTKRKHGQFSLASVLECVGDEALAQPAMLEALLDLGVDERDDAAAGLVGGDRGKLAIHTDLVSLALVDVGDYGAHCLCGAG